MAKERLKFVIFILPLSGLVYPKFIYMVMSARCSKQAATGNNES
jgi:hypothetical protein